MLKKFIINKFPGIGKYKRIGFALRDKLVSKKSYSQFSEDILILDILKKSKIDKKKNDICRNWG